MNAKHTPGPWQVNRNGQTHVEAARDGQGINIIANCDDPDDIRTRDEDRANAKLIATSPDLLAFARECARADSDCGPAVREAARVLVAKATA